MRIVADAARFQSWSCLHKFGRWLSLKSDNRDGEEKESGQIASYLQVDGYLDLTTRIQDAEVPVTTEGAWRQRSNRFVADQKPEIAQQQKCCAMQGGTFGWHGSAHRIVGKFFLLSLLFLIIVIGPSNVFFIFT